MAAPASGAAQSPTTIQTAPNSSTTTLTSRDTASKTTYSSKLGGAKARLSENVAPGAASPPRPASTQRAWASSNLLPNRQVQQNGATSSPQGSATGETLAVLREGLTVKVTLDTGAEFQGIYSTSSDTTHTLRMVQQKKLPGSADMSNGSARANRDLPNMSFQKRDVAGIHVTGAALPPRDAKQQNGTSSVFRTDGAISGNKLQGERTLKKWVPDDGIKTDTSLEKSSSGSWDQFAENERLFGLKTDYDETIYTTVIDKSHPDYQRRVAEADKKAREIEASATSNRHVAEERVTDNLVVDDSGLDEEDKYSGVQKQNFPSQDFPPLSSTGGPAKYTPPARRPAAPKELPTLPNNDPSIIASGNSARPAVVATDANKSKTVLATDTNKPKIVVAADANKPKAVLAADANKAKSSLAADANKPTPVSKSSKPDAITTPTTNDSSSRTGTPDLKATPTNTSATTSRNESPQARPAATLNATATVERDVVHAFKGFAAQQRSQADKLRSNKAKADKEVKLNDLRNFAATFKLNSPLPNDLVAIIAKDPAKQREIQETARRNALEAQTKEVTAASTAVSNSGPSTADPKTASRVTPSQGPTSAPVAPNRQNIGRAGAVPPQGPQNSQSFRADRPGQTQTAANQPVRQGSSLSTRTKQIEQSKGGHLPNAGQEARQPPTGPANGTDGNFSRRSSAVGVMGGRLNPTSNEFRPSTFTPSFNPNGNPSTGSSPRSNSVVGTSTPIPSPSSSLLRRKPLQTPPKKSGMAELDIIECAAKIKPPSGKDWSHNGDIMPAFDTLPMWRQPKDNEPETSTMKQTYTKMFETQMFSNQTMSPPQPSHINPQVPHLHQLPFHLQSGAHNMSQRQSPRQPPVHVHNNQHNHGHNAPYNATDDHRMMSSHSAQSYASPRLQQVNMAYPSPMGQSPQLAFTQPGMPYQMVPGGPQIPQYRSYSGGPQFMQQQPGHMGGQVMIPAGNAFMGGPAMMSPAPQMMYPVGQAYPPQGTGPPPSMPGANGYPSPGRSAPMMMQQGSQQGQPVYGMSPGMQFGQPVYAQPGQMPNVRGYPPQGQQPFGTSPQMSQYGQPHRGGPSAGYNKNYQQHHGQHPPNQLNHIPTGPQSRGADGEEPK